MATTDRHDQAVGGQFSLIASVLGRLEVLQIARCVIFLATVLAIWVSLRPFPDLTATDFTDVESGKFASTYITLGMLSIVAVALTASQNLKAFHSLMTPAFVLLCCWIGINTLFSHDVGLSFQRLILTACVVALAASLLLLPHSQAELDLWLATAALILLALCYLGVLLAPKYSMHTAGDMFEEHLAGDWRGSFGHKNVAAPIMAMLIFVGLYLTSRKSLISGIAIAGLSSVFLVFSGGKSAMGLFVLTLVLSSLVYALKSVWLRAIVCFLPLLTLNALTVGSVFDDRLAEVVKLLPIDTTFTGRTDIWEFAISSLGLRPFLGYGFAAFWGTDSIEKLVKNEQYEWAATASHSHNGYLDTALTMGYPGLALIIFIFVYSPLKDFSVAARSGNAGPLAKLFMRLWLFGIYLSSMESFLLDRADPIWFTFLVAVFGLHYISRFRLKSESTAP
ncbi:MAG: O-antigen ligase [Bradyrhizobium sp.]|nr:O-antigen ligase [Bradyrhizobium sp.]